MLRWLPAPLVAVLTFSLMLAALLLSFALFVPIALLKAITPWPSGRAWLARHGLDRFIGTGLWRGLNRLIYLTMHGPRRDVRIEGKLDRDKTWLLICNHQSWTDIPLLLDLFGDCLPFPRFFLKQQLIWVPVIGAACWAFDMPFVKRHSKEAIAGNPALKQQDLDATRKACEKYRRIPVTVVNFLEGTGFCVGLAQVPQATSRRLRVSPLVPAQACRRYLAGYEVGQTLNGQLQPGGYRGAYCDRASGAQSHDSECAREIARVWVHQTAPYLFEGMRCFMLQDFKRDIYRATSARGHRVRNNYSCPGLSSGQ